MWGAKIVLVLQRICDVLHLLRVGDPRDQSQNEAADQGWKIFFGAKSLVFRSA